MLKCCLNGARLPARAPGPAGHPGGARASRSRRRGRRRGCDPLPPEGRRRARHARGERARGGARGTSDRRSRRAVGHDHGRLGSARPGRAGPTGEVLVVPARLRLGELARARRRRRGGGASRLRRGRGGWPVDGGGGGVVAGLAASRRLCARADRTAQTGSIRSVRSRRRIDFWAQSAAEYSGPAPLLLHGEGSSCWPAFRHAVRLGLQRRIGLEDVLTTPDGQPAADNTALVEAARRLSSPHGPTDRRVVSRRTSTNAAPTRWLTCERREPRTRPTPGLLWVTVIAG